MIQDTVLTSRFCAICGAAATADKQRFCPRCGANMDIVNNDDDDDTRTIKYRPVKHEQIQESDATVRLSSPRKLYLKTTPSQELVPLVVVRGTTKKAECNKKVC